MRDPFIAIDAATDLRSRARELRRSWERALGGDDPGGSVRPVIEASWRRTAHTGVDPDHPDPRRAFDRDDLDEVRDGSGLRECIDVLRSVLGTFAHDAEHVMVVVDAQCRILWMEGDPRVRRRAEGIVFEEGMCWTEASVGTNAIGTAMAIDHAVQVFSAEHFSAKQHPWWCSAAPIHDPATGELLGVVDLSGPMRTAHPHSLALVRAAAGMAEELLRTRRQLADERLRRVFAERTLGRPAVLVAADGRVLEGGAALPDGAGSHAEVAGNASAPAVRLAVPPGGGPVALPDGRVLLAEPLPGGHVLWDDPATPPQRVLRLELLGTAPRAHLAGAPVALSLRHAEVLCILALHPEGLSADALTLALYGDAGKRVSTRSEVSRLRAALPGVVGAQPYRLLTAVETDLGSGHASLLPASTAPRVVRARAELDAAARRTALSGPLDALWTFLQTPTGRDDADALAQFVRRAGGEDPRRAQAAARLRSLQVMDLL